MKRLIFAFLLPIILRYGIIATPVLANQTSYLRIISESAGFYSDQSCTDLICNLPYTYYVKVIEDLGEVCHVECYDGKTAPSLDGYVNKAHLFSDDLDKSSPYACKVIKTSSTAPFYSSLNSAEPSMYVFKDREMTYYGFIKTPSGSVYYFVNYNGKPGYVSEEFILPFSLENHPNPLTFIVQEEPKQEDAKEENSDSSTNQSLPAMSEQNVLRMVIILLIIVAGFIAVFASRHPKKREITTDIDQEDYP